MLIDLRKNIYYFQFNTKLAKHFKKILLQEKKLYGQNILFSPLSGKFTYEVRYYTFKQFFDYDMLVEIMLSAFCS